MLWNLAFSGRDGERTRGGRKTKSGTELFPHYLRLQHRSADWWRERERKLSLSLLSLIAFYHLLTFLHSILLVPCAKFALLTVLPTTIKISVWV